MINQPFGSKPKWFTHQPTTTKGWNPRGRGSDPRFSSPTSGATLEVKYQSPKPDELTIDLRNVVGWRTIPIDNKKVHRFGVEILEIQLSAGVYNNITLYNQKGNPEVKLAKWNNDSRTMGPMEKFNIPQPELTQIDDFFDAMLAANLL